VITSSLNELPSSFKSHEAQDLFPLEDDGIIEEFSVFKVLIIEM
jgi:hypothetical protein